MLLAKLTKRVKVDAAHYQTTCGGWPPRRVPSKSSVSFWWPSTCSCWASRYFRWHLGYSVIRSLATWSWSSKVVLFYFPLAWSDLDLPNLQYCPCSIGGLLRTWWRFGTWQGHPSANASVILWTTAAFSSVTLGMPLSSHKLSTSFLYLLKINFR